MTLTPGPVGVLPAGFSGQVTCGQTQYPSHTAVTVNDTSVYRTDTIHTTLVQHTLSIKSGK